MFYHPVKSPAVNVLSSRWVPRTRFAPLDDAVAVSRESSPLGGLSLSFSVCLAAHLDGEEKILIF